jgi:hypothetical protein
MSSRGALADAFPGRVGKAVALLGRVSSLLASRGWVEPLVPALEAAIAEEVVQARRALQKKDYARAEHHAGRVHILGSYFFVPHGFSHATHLRICLAAGDLRGAMTQALRLAGTPGSALFTPYFGSTGHPGSSDRPVGSRWPIPADLQELLEQQPRPRRQMPAWLGRILG